MIWSQVLQMGGGAGWPAFAFVGPLFGLLVMGAVIYLLGRVLTTSSASSAQQDDAMETLRQRYARGEIDEEEFEKQARTLRQR